MGTKDWFQYGRASFWTRSYSRFSTKVGLSLGWDYSHVLVYVPLLGDRNEQKLIQCSKYFLCVCHLLYNFWNESNSK